MKSRLFTIPNVLTLLNLLCGSLAVIYIAVYGDYLSAFYSIIAALVFDFLDGFAARLLGQVSPIGIFLDSLSDLVSFGLAPSMVLFSLIRTSQQVTGNPFIDEWGCYLSLLVVLFSSLRLARFSVEQSDEDDFIGLPTPICALLVASFGAMYQLKGADLGVMQYIGWSVSLSYLLISNMRMLSLKFKGFSLKKNLLRYIFLILCVVELVLLGLYAVPIIFVTYILFSVVLKYINSKSGNV